MRRLTVRVLWAALLLIGLAGEADAERVALVIGNDAYENVPQLRKAVNDAGAMDQVLSGIGFSVIKAENVSRRDMNAQLQLFASKLDPGDEALFYFAGHGIEIDGRNFLLPVDVPKAAPGQEDFVQSEAVDADRILNMIRSRGARVSILILDACRDNPFPPVGARTVGGTRGLARMPTPDGTFIMYSADAGQTALDRLSDNDPDPNSVYTRSLIPLLTRPGLSLPELARDVRGAVQKLARGVSHDQRPVYYDAITGEFYFGGEGQAQAGNAAGAPVSSGDSAVELAFWNSVQNSESPAAIREYLTRYPSGVFAGLAKIRLESLDRPAGDQKLAALPPADAPSAAAGVAVTDCDRLAASEYDPLKVAAHVAFDKIDAAKAIAACREALEQHPDDPRFSFQLARALHKGGDHREVLRLYNQLSEQNYSAAMVNLGKLHEEGTGVALNSDEAARWYRKAADLGHPLGMYNLATMYRSGHGVTKDFAEAARWFRKSADLGIGDAMVTLGWMYQHGEGVPQDLAEAVSLFRRSADLNDPAGTYNLGVVHENAMGVPQDFAEAVRLYRKSAGLGDDSAMRALGNSYFNGRGVAKDTAEAARWYERSAELGDVDAMHNLADLYARGDGVTKNPRIAASHMLGALKGRRRISRRQMTETPNNWSADFRRALQTLMKSEGLYDGPIDGKFGPGVRAAIERMTAN